MDNNYPKLHNATWPGVVGKGPDTPEPFIELDTMLDLTAAAEVDGTRFDGVDLFLCAPHVDIDSSDDDIARLAEKLQSRNLVAGSLVAPVWPPTGGGSERPTALSGSTRRSNAERGSPRSSRMRPHSCASPLPSFPRSATTGKPNEPTSTWKPDDPPLKTAIYRRGVALSK